MTEAHHANYTTTTGASSSSSSSSSSSKHSDARVRSRAANISLSYVFSAPTLILIRKCAYSTSRADTARDVKQRKTAHDTAAKKATRNTHPAVWA